MKPGSGRVAVLRRRNAGKAAAFALPNMDLRPSRWFPARCGRDDLIYGS
jgi:hypothetical protein